MIPLSSLDVTRDVLDFSLMMRSGVDPADVDFTLLITNWTSEGLTIQANFTHPFQISAGFNEDIVICKIKNQNLFISEDGLRKLSNANVFLEKSIPRQLPNGMKEEELQGQASQISGGMKGVFIAQILI